jgi:hypothetical protein
LPDGNILSLAIDNLENKWIGTGAGLASYDENVWTVYDTSQSDFPFRDSDVDIVTTDKSGNVWIGSYGRGVGKFDGTTWTAFNTSNSELPSNFILSISIDSTGNKWIGTGGRGLVKYTDSTWTIYNTTNSDLPFDWVYSIAIDSLGNKWIGGFGLAVFNDRRWINYNSGVFNTTVKTLEFDKTGIVWIGTSSDGLIAFNPGEVFPPNTPPQIISDAEAIAYEDSLFIYTARAVDSEDSLITFTFSEYPLWLTPGDSIISGIVLREANDTSFFVIASDGELTDTLIVIVKVGATFIDELDRLVPDSFSLKQNYPNPFNQETIIKYHLPEKSAVRLVIYNLAGKQIATFVHELLPAGVHFVKWDGTDDAGNEVPSGIYLYRIVTNKNIQEKKMILLK